MEALSLEEVENLQRSLPPPVLAAIDRITLEYFEHVRQGDVERKEAFLATLRRRDLRAEFGEAGRRYLLSGLDDVDAVLGCEGGGDATPSVECAGAAREVLAPPTPVDG